MIASSVAATLCLDQREDRIILSKRTPSASGGNVRLGPRLCENSIGIGPNAVLTTNFCDYSFSTRPHASKITVRFYRAEFSHSLGREETSNLRD
jgi:hypothetical protein